MTARLKTISALFLVLTGFVGCSYLSELPQYRWEKQIESEMAEQTLFTGVPTYQSIDAISPVTWFAPHASALSYVMPDPDHPAGFYVASFVYDDVEPTIFHYEVDCEAEETLVSSTLNDEGAVRRDALGDPVTTEDGQVFHYHQVRPRELDDMEARWFCERNWDEKRSSLRANRG